MTGIDTDRAALRHAAGLVADNQELCEHVALRATAATYDNQATHGATSAQDVSNDASSQRHNSGAAGSSEMLQGDIMRQAAQWGPFQFCVCNPPFFESAAEAGQNPDTAHGGIAAEMACPGGEHAFVSRMIDESIQMPTMCHWFTTMLGKKSSFRQLRKRLNAMSDVSAVRSGELAQGRTHRWVLAWSFQVPRTCAEQALLPGKRCAVDSELNYASSKQPNRC